MTERERLIALAKLAEKQKRENEREDADET